MKAPTMLPEKPADTSKLVKLVNYSKDNISLAAGSRFTDNISISVPSGYTAIGIKSASVGNASSSGANSGNCRFYGFITNSTSISIRYANDGSSAAKIKIEGQVICFRSDAL